MDKQLHSTENDRCDYLSMYKWTNNYIPLKMTDVITYQCTNLDGRYTAHIDDTVQLH